MTTVSFINMKGLQNSESSCTSLDYISQTLSFLLSGRLGFVSEFEDHNSSLDSFNVEELVIHNQ